MVREDRKGGERREEKEQALGKRKIMERGAALHVTFCHLSHLIVLKICHKMMGDAG